MRVRDDIRVSSTSAVLRPTPAQQHGVRRDALPRRVRTVSAARAWRESRRAATCARLRSRRPGRVGGRRTRRVHRPARDALPEPRRRRVGRRAAEVGRVPGCRLARAAAGARAGLELVEQVLQPGAEQSRSAAGHGRRPGRRRHRRPDEQRHRAPAGAGRPAGCAVRIRCGPQIAIGTSGAPVARASATAPGISARTVYDVLTPASGKIPTASPSPQQRPRPQVRRGRRRPVHRHVAHARHQRPGHRVLPRRRAGPGTARRRRLAGRPARPA